MNMTSMSLSLFNTLWHYKVQQEEQYNILIWQSGKYAIQITKKKKNM